ncbi:methyl-accepting chemotaxis protein [Bacterioplanoides pacificum]|uniref:Methyl-accepting chemotaxis protein n=1 Tax=Bacterioplanoides pacificum TaxID=1171596 RepID=A0ABV7VRP5_9GAMM
MNFLSHIGVRNKLWGLVAVALAGALLVQLFAAYQSRSLLIDGRQQQIRHLVDNAVALVDHYYQQRDQLGDELAKQRAFEALRALRYDEGKGYFWVNNHQLTLLMHPMKPQREGKDMSQVRDGDGQLHWQAMRDAVLAAGGGFVNYRYQGPQFDQPADKVSYVKEFAPWGWIIGTGVYLTDVQAQFIDLTQRSLLIFILVIAAVLLLAALLARNIIQPLEAMVALMSQVAQGNLQVEASDQRRKDELGKLNRSFSQLLVTFRELIRHNRDANERIVASVEQAEVVAAQTEGGMDQQYAETDSLASAVEELSATLQEVSANTSDTHQLTAAVRQQIGDSNDKMNRTVEAVTQASESVDHAAAVVSKLEQDLQQIDSILDVIRNISEQTNLLALNAAIEAVRAGESGRGFAVVADEVRSLAQRTHESTEEIQSMTEALQSEALKAVTVMQRSVQQAHDGRGFAETTGDGLQQATDDVNAVAARIAQVADTVLQQSNVIEEVSHNVARIRNIARETRQGSELVSANRQVLSDLVRSGGELLRGYRY